MSIKVLASLAAVALCATACTAPASNSRVAPPPPTVSQVEAEDALCSATHFALSPDGRHVASWVGPDDLPPLHGRRGTASASVTPLDCLGAASCRSWSITQFELFDRLTWGADGQSIFVFGRDRRIHRLALDQLVEGTLTYTDSARLPPGLNDRLLVHGATLSRTAADERARLTPSPLADTFLAYRPGTPAEWRPEIAAFDAMGLVAALVSDDRFVYRRVAADGVIGAPLFPRPLANDIQPVRTNEGQIRFVAAGSILRLDGGVAIEEPDPGYARPVLDASSGAMLGRSSERDVILPNNLGWLSHRVAGALSRSGSSVLRDIQVLPERDLAWVTLLHHGEEFLLLGPDMEQTLRCGDGKDRQLYRDETSQSLAMREVNRETPLTSTVSTRQFVLGEGAQRLFVRELSREGVRRGVVVFFHGGPHGSLAQHGYGNQISEFLDAGFRVLAVDYSGSAAAFEVIRRLSVHGIDAIRADVALLSEHLDQRQYENVMVYGESFGSVPAAALVEHAPNLVHGVVLVAPYLLHRNPSTWGRQRQMSERDIAYQRRSDEVLISQPNMQGSVARWLQGLPSRWPAGLPTLLIFGALDPVSQAGDWSYSSANVTIINSPGENHEGLLTSLTTNDRVARFLDARAESDDGR